MTRDQIAQAALALPLPELIELTETLRERIRSTDKCNEQFDPEVIQQAVKRGQELESGAVQGIPHDEVMRAARRALRCD